MKIKLNKIILFTLFILISCGEDYDGTKSIENTITKHSIMNNVNSYVYENKLYMNANNKVYSEYHTLNGYGVELPELIKSKNPRIEDGDELVFYYYVDSCSYIYDSFIKAFVRQCNNPIIWVESCANFIIVNKRGYKVTLVVEYKE